MCASFVLRGCCSNRNLAAAPAEAALEYERELVLAAIDAGITTAELARCFRGPEPASALAALVPAATSLKPLLKQARAVAYYENVTPFKPWTLVGMGQQTGSWCGAAAALVILLAGWLVSPTVLDKQSFGAEPLWPG